VDKLGKKVGEHENELQKFRKFSSLSCSLKQHVFTKGNCAKLSESGADRRFYSSKQ
jgi:hypothetical protein